MGGFCYPERNKTYKRDDTALKIFAIQSVITGKLQIVRFIRQDAIHIYMLVSSFTNNTGPRVPQISELGPEFTTESPKPNAQVTAQKKRIQNVQ